ILDSNNQDVRGVAAAYLDLMFNQTLVQPVVDADNAFGFAIQFGPNPLTPNFGEPQTGDINTPGLVDEVGGFRGAATPLGTNAVEVFTIRFVVAPTATNGVANFLTDPADDSPQSDVLLLGDDGDVIVVGASQLLLSQTPVNVVLGTPVDNTGLPGQPEPVD